MEHIAPRRDLPADVARSIRAARVARGWTRAEAARAIGMSSGFLGNLERGIRAPSLALAADIAAVLELDHDVAERLREVAVRGRGRDRPGYALRGRPTHERRLELPTLRAWLARQSTGTAEQVDAFIATCDRQRLKQLNDEMCTVGQALRRFVASDDALMRCELSETVARALEHLEGEHHAAAP